ncbi:DUF982 domain-containing protein [Pararhizobium haloflavum]|uniref:DUF982 domain-containing protein n=1 Tax=Pararhizobium haloflavum TaxID=2037914 RepID=UPI000C18897B|nr:DUF982 domain-containing protein [Pararhizobium haloflavum]
MPKGTFAEPINTLVGIGFVKPICSVEDAYIFLMEWRGLQASDHAHKVALKAVRAALAGEIEPDTARSFVEIFARKAGLLAPVMDTVIASTTVTRRSGAPVH